MRRSSYDHARHQTGSDYYSHVNRMARAPSVLTDVPHYGALFSNNPVPSNEAHRGGHYDQHQQRQHHQHNPEPGRNVVQVTETVAQCDRDGNCVVIEEKVDVEADDYIQQKHKGFELFKWKTFKPR
ncbi:hypothetical protein RchiOBHm_Chr7g0192561 [Rosa chinensis]|uniref:Uncharacterized protein n=1 Tax=Rosa chinensis TaxID=74649 RepID=A0A2P6P5J8_ROSCH|nr:hypothetical protein RchiOBHm_Chr7g0192561 [Rosa chinensis]